MEFPGSEWPTADPAAAGFDPSALIEAIQYAIDSEIDWPEDVSALVARDDPPPFNRTFGPTKPRGGANGLVIHQGQQVASWGDPTRVDMTFSATKSYLSTCAGLAYDDGLIRDLDAPVREAIASPWFDDANAAITWRHLLQQTSEWAGTLFDIPDTVDHNRAVGRDAGAFDTDAVKGEERPRHTPGTFWEYNDVRVNLLGAALLKLWRRPLADLIATRIMQPIGATTSWQWHPYDHAYLEIDGIRMPSVPGGGHWGGGLWISANDHARFGHLLLNRGVWNGRRLLSETWIDAATTPCPINPAYGFMWWLNPDGATWQTRNDAFAAMGAGGNLVAIIPEHDLVIVTRWAGDPNGVINHVVGAIR